MTDPNTSTTTDPNTANTDTTTAKPNDRTVLTEGNSEGGKDEDSGKKTENTDDKGGEGGGKKAAEDKAPDQYADFKIPDGFEADTESLKTFKDLAKGLNLSQDKAQKLVDFQASFLEKYLSEQVKVWGKLRNDWLEEAKADPEIGGAKFKEVTETAKKALKALGTPKLVEMIETYGIGNHPEFIRFVTKVGNLIKDDTVVPPGKGGGDDTKTLAERIFG